MPHTQDGLPFAAGSQTSYKAAVAAAVNRKTKTARYIRLLALKRSLTDHEASTATGWPLSSICSIRNGAVSCGLVERGHEERQSPWGRDCATWVLTSAGLAAVEKLQAA